MQKRDMKARFFAIAALVLGMASCAKDFAPEANLGGEVDFTLAVSAPELAATRADGDEFAGHNSAYGAIDYLSDAEWENVDLRYTLEVYDVADDYTNATPIKDRQVKIVDKYEGVTFETRLAPKRNYHFVVFADFVPEDASDNPALDVQAELGKRHSIGVNLTQITLKEDAINDEYADAYFGTLDFNPSNNTHNKVEKPMVLTRPYAKMRVVATDLAELNLNVEPAYVKVSYTAPHLVGFNAVSGAIATEAATTEYDYHYAAISKWDLSKHVYTEGYDAKTVENADKQVRHSHMTLFTDYILATDTQKPIQFTMLVCDQYGNPIKETAFNTEIPVQRNHLTTIIGNVLTTATEVDVTIDDNFECDIEGNSQERILLETLINGGVFDLTEDLTITAPTWLKGDAVIRLNGYTLTYDIPTDKESDDKYAIMTRVENGSTLTFKGEGNVVSEGYIASVNAGGVLNISEGTFESEGCTVFQSNGGEIYISGGEFKAAEYNGDHRYTINFVDSKKQEGLIEISGGRFYKYNPSESNSENPAMDFCANGYWGVEDGEWYVVVPLVHYELYADHAKVWTAEGLIQWAYIVNNGATAALKALPDYDESTFNKNSYGLEIMANIKLPMFTVEADPASETYVYTSTPITITDGKPSGSNWVTVGTVVSGFDQPEKFVDTFVYGNNKVVRNLTMNSTTQITGFIGYCENVEIKDLKFDNATIYSTNSYAAPLAYVDDGSYVKNIHTTNSHFVAKNYAGGIASFAMEHYDHYEGSHSIERLMDRIRENSSIQRLMPIVTIEGCTVDANTTVKATNVYAGGICGQSWGALIVDCVNRASVSANEEAGGICGRVREYRTNQNAYVVNCANYGSVEANKNFGGIVGYFNLNSPYTYMARCCTTVAPVYGKCVGGGTLYSLGNYVVGTSVDFEALNAEIAEYNAHAAAYEFAWAFNEYSPVYASMCYYNSFKLPQAKLW